MLWKKREVLTCWSCQICSIGKINPQVFIDYISRPGFKIYILWIAQ